MRLSISSLDKSPKLNGKYETLIINQLIDYFNNNDYEVQSHISLNIAWGSVLSEIDLILFKNNDITVVEVKSKNDKITSVYKQIETYKKFADFIFIASNDMLYKYNLNKDVGLIYVNDEVNIIRKASRINNLVYYNDLKTLKKKCLLKILDDNISIKKHSKEDIINLIKYKIQHSEVHNEFKKVLFCDKKCELCTI